MRELKPRWVVTPPHIALNEWSEKRSLAHVWNWEQGLRQGGQPTARFLKRVGRLSPVKAEVGRFLRRMRSRPRKRYSGVVFSTPGVPTSSEVEGAFRILNTHAF